MLNVIPHNRVIVVAVLATLAAGPLVAQQQGPARGTHDWAPPAPQGKQHSLAATLDTVQWGWLDPREKPKLTIDSGDTVTIETMMHSHDKIQPGTTMECSGAIRARQRDPVGL